MSILKYFKLSKTADQLLDPEGTLSSKLPCSSIASAILAVHTVIETSGTRGLCLNLSLAQKIQIGKKASKLGVASVLHSYKKNFHNLLLKEMSVRRFKHSYQELLR